MKILTLHADFIEFEPKKKALKDAEKASKGKRRVEECLVVFTAVEKRDEKDTGRIVKRYVKEVEDIAKQVKAKKIVLYPYAHLSSDLASPAKALLIMKEAEKVLKKKFKVTRASFGWYKSFDVSCKGHPLSELSREFGPEETKEEESTALKAEKKLKSHWHILDLKGKLNRISIKGKKPSGFNFGRWKGLEKFANYEINKTRVSKEEPPHVKLMKKLELVDYEPGSDPGNLRFYPKGRFVKGLLERFVTSKVKEYGAMEIEAPIMYDFEHPALKSYMHRFPARQYTIQTPNKKVFLRFAACFGQFLMLHDAQVSYKHMPLRMYEMASSFRVEQHGELTGLRRLRAFTMPDTHAFCTDEKQAKEEMLRRFELSHDIQKGIGFEVPSGLELGIRVTKNFFEENKDFLVKMVKKWGKPALVEMWDKRFFYFIMKYEWNFVDALDKCSALTTDQIDIENAERYGITYVGKKGEKKFPLILHCSPSGAIERVMYALLEKAAISEKSGSVAQLPLWLSPTQIRLVPVSVKKYLKFCEKVSSELEKENIRVDIDDRDESVGKRIRESAKEWIPYVLVVGEKEKKGKSFIVRDRGKGNEAKMSKSALVKLIKGKTSSMPFESLPLPKLLSKRIGFVG